MPRRAAVVIALLAAVVAVPALRAGVGPVTPVDRPPVAGESVAEESATRPMAPLDHLPGRTPIPAPVAETDRVGGELPPLTGPGRAAAVRAVRLVLGRYCLRPDLYRLTTAPLDGWLSLGVLAVEPGRDDGALVDVSLVWTGHTYRWAGVPDQLRIC
ncbi:MAG TPA: hypothetical protein VI357_16880 [Mycobacteriales bacterium]